MPLLTRKTTRGARAGGGRAGMKEDSEVLENLSKKKKTMETNSRDVGLFVARAALTERPGKREHEKRREALGRNRRAATVL